MNKILQILCSVLVLALCIYLCYFKTGLGFSHEYMPVSSMPCWISSIIFCIFIPIMVYSGIEEQLNKNE